MREYMALVDRHRAKTEREDYHAGLICAVLANVNRDPKQRREPFTPQDFMPQRMVAESEPPADGDMLPQLMAFAGALGAQVVIHD